MEVVKIYILLDENQQIRYVGKTNQSLDKRLIQHIFEGRNNNKTKKERWINSLLKKEKTPTITLIDSALNGSIECALSKACIVSPQGISIDLMIDPILSCE